MQYIYTLLEEKNIDLHTTFEFTVDGEWNLMELGVVVEYIEKMGKENQNKVASTLRQIDFKNGNVLHFFEYIAKGIATGAC